MKENSEKVLLVVVAKEPVPGKVKTRLFPELKAEEAAAIYQCMIVDRIREICNLDNIDLAIAFTPTNARDAFVPLAQNSFTLLAQRGKDLGERLNNIFMDSFAKGYQAVSIIDSDSPDLPKSIIQESFTFLLSQKCDVVLGPCLDGGYYLIGMKKPHPELFENIIWSTGTVLNDTLKKTRKIGVKTILLSWWNDLDTFDDLIEFYKKYSGNKLSNNQRGGRTLEFLSRLSIINQSLTS